MAANIEQIFQDFILNKIREIEDQNEDRANGAEAVPSGEMKAAAADKSTSDKHEDFRGSQKKHKKHKKHKSKKKKRNRDKESSCESGAEVERGSKRQSRRGTPTEARKERGADHESKSRCHKQHSTGKKKKKKKRRKGEENSSDSDSAFVSKQRESKCGQSLPLRRQEELPDIIPKQDSSNQGRADEERLGRRSLSHSNSRSHSDSKHLHRRSRTRSRSGSPGCRTRSSSSEKRRDLDEALRSTKSPSERLQPQLDLRPTEANIRLEEMTESRTEDQPEKPGESKGEAAEQPASGCGTSQSTSTEPSFLQSKPAEGPKCPPAEVKTAAKKKRKQSRSPQRNRKSSKKQKRSRSPCRSYRRGSRSRSSSLKKRSRSRSGGRKSWRSRSRSASRSRRRVAYSQRDRWKREPSHSPVLILRKNRSPSRKHGSSSTSPQRISDLDKEQLLEIAKANAAAMCAKAGMPIPASLRSTVLPLALPTMAMNAAMASMTAATVTAALSNMGTLSSLLPLPSITNKPPPGPAQASIAALEEVKRKVAKQANSISIKEFTDKCQMIVDSTGELPVALPHVSDEEDDGKPFGGSALREQKVISFSINNTTVRPAVRSDAGMAKEFPVSSGSQHRKKEGEGLGVYGEWVPIDKTTEKASVSSRKAVTNVTMTTTSSSSSDPAEAVVLPEAEQTGFTTDKVFPDPLVQPVDITQAVTERIKAQRRLAENPYDISAICMLSRAQEQVDAWAQSNTVPGLFTGSTGAQVLSSEELSTSGPQAWLKKDQFLKAAPVSGGVGEFLMRKMGWKTGEGLGRNREGTVEPIVIDFKVDRKGLVAEGEKPQKQTGGLVVTKDLMGKHPVSALIELCNKRRIMQPDFVMVHHSGPDHRKNFLFKVGHLNVL
ncbi:protein SON [Acanthochromis polyacanthus]|uniref:protein SON n=1 Tax=Acanthochromis polyacanthus TaxID=80966 RepID=UPI0022344D3A|nr:protein SON [Acanthochromis polyacanthus]XP_051799262.1 protein SON [Acanthochromis polyacanthus]XP_051799263.1 protein SON [Acanthochromis polyacanthus]XP_051799264.1 protein SON [Acanthochromis polyacanthus]XP_051799265.1 protein SON [Acanthochromis polyacanthus]XP_051799266.1 protein SON [Acanthochromis polyacanthus]XP_051799267.1 protein SON [Acanthochromis polyacanthus]XP_051799268.1 protein SON [Acanthochromis polyacanthus]XP_051799269.1 protein SON [Acanthochromis polyacanthus]XP